MSCDEFSYSAKERSRNRLARYQAEKGAYSEDVAVVLVAPVSAEFAETMRELWRRSDWERDNGYGMPASMRNS